MLKSTDTSKISFCGSIDVQKLNQNEQIIKGEWLPDSDISLYKTISIMTNVLTFIDKLKQKLKLKDKTKFSNLKLCSNIRTEAFKKVIILDKKN